MRAQRARRGEMEAAHHHLVESDQVSPSPEALCETAGTNAGTHRPVLTSVPIRAPAPAPTTNMRPRARLRLRPVAPGRHRALRALPGGACRSFGLEAPIPRTAWPLSASRPLAAQAVPPPSLWRARPHLTPLLAGGLGGSGGSSRSEVKCLASPRDAGHDRARRRPAAGATLRRKPISSFHGRQPRFDPATTASGSPTLCDGCRAL